MKCPACTIEIEYVNCQCCGRSPQERAKWLIARWKRDGVWLELGPGATDEHVEEFRVTKWKCRRNARHLGRASLEQLPDADETIAKLEALIALAENDEHDVWGNDGVSSDPAWQEALWERARHQAELLDGMQVAVIRPCERDHDSKHPRWDTNFGRCACADSVMDMGRVLVDAKRLAR